MTTPPHVTVPEVAIAQALIREWTDETPTGVLSRSRVIDRLLDLRNVLGSADQQLVDATLAAVPGLTLVDSEWWVATLAALGDAIAAAAEEGLTPGLADITDAPLADPLGNP